MDISACFYLGRVVKPFGYKGELVLILDVDDPGVYINLESVYVMQSGKLVPYLFSHISQKPNSNQIIAGFYAVDTEEKARAMCGNEMYLPLSLLPELRDDQFYYHEIEGFRVIDKEHGEIGHVRQVLDLPGNPLLEIEHQSKEILVPLRDEFIERLDREKRTLYINTPEGLVNLFTTE